MPRDPPSVLGLPGAVRTASNIFLTVRAQQISTQAWGIVPILLTHNLDGNVVIPLLC